MQQVQRHLSTRPLALPPRPGTRSPAVGTQLMRNKHSPQKTCLREVQCSPSQPEGAQGVPRCAQGVR